MFEIKGKVNTAVCYAKTAEDEAIEQIRRMCDYDFTQNNKIRIMPDVHAGKGCTIGTTMTVTDKVVPNIVGVDIGCGMYTVCLGKGDINFAELDEAAHFVPSGMNIWEERQETYFQQRDEIIRTYKKQDRIKELAGIYTTSINEDTIDEAPMAYKSLEDIIGVIEESVDVIEIMKPIYNFKAS